MIKLGDEVEFINISGCVPAAPAERRRAMPRRQHVGDGEPRAESEPGLALANTRQMYDHRDGAGELIGPGRDASVEAVVLVQMYTWVPFVRSRRG